MPYTGDELHHFGWNACSSALCPYAPHPHIERRYLVVPGLRSSRIYVLDTKDDPVKPAIMKILEPEELAKRAGYSRPHTVHCGPEGLYLSASAGPTASDGPGGDRAARPQLLRGARPLGGRPRPAVPRVRRLVAHRPRRRGHHRVGHAVDDRGRRERRPAARAASTATSCTSGTCASARTSQRVDLGDEHQMVLELRPAHDPTKTYGFVGVVVSVEDLSASVWVWYREDGEFGGPQGHHDPGRAGRFRRRPAAGHRRRSARCRRWSPTSTCPWTTVTSTSPAGVPASSSATT